MIRARLITGPNSSVGTPRRGFILIDGKGSEVGFVEDSGYERLRAALVRCGITVASKMDYDVYGHVFRKSIVSAYTYDQYRNLLAPMGPVEPRPAGAASNFTAHNGVHCPVLLSRDHDTGLITIDLNGNPVHHRVYGLEGVTINYDENGRVASIHVQGAK
jgi:hypothetical protein